MCFNIEKRKWCFYIINLLAQKRVTLQPLNFLIDLSEFSNFTILHFDKVQTILASSKTISDCLSDFWFRRTSNKKDSCVILFIGFVQQILSVSQNFPRFHLLHPPIFLNTSDYFPAKPLLGAINNIATFIAVLTASKDFLNQVHCISLAF